MATGLIAVSYIGAAVLFILSLGGLSNQETSRRGNIYGIVGMAIAIAATVVALFLDAEAYRVPALILVPTMIVGALIGVSVALRVEMTQMPQLVAILHSFVRPGGGPDRHRQLRRSRNDGALPGRRENHPRCRDLSRRLYRRDHLHRLGDRLRQAAGLDFRQAADAAGPPSAEPYRDYRDPGPDGPLPGGRRYPKRPVAPAGHDRDRLRHRRATWSWRSAAPTCRSWSRC